MPFYEYQCGECGHRLEVLQKISDAPLEYCPQCNAPALKKLISASAFRLKGTGWYETDFKSSGKKNGTSDTKSDAGKSSSGSEAPSGAKSGGSESAKPKGSSATGSSAQAAG